MKQQLLLLSLFVLLILSACGGKKTQYESADADDSAAVLAQEEMVASIKELYAAAAKNEGDIDDRFACHEWRKMVAAVNEKDTHVEEIGFFNDDFWTMMQDDNPSDLEARDIKFEQLDVEKGRATVSFILHSSVQTIHQKFIFCHEDGNWRVHDIIRFNKDSDGEETSFSFVEAMRSYINEQQKDVPELTYANMEGIYDDEKQEWRICLNEDGTATLRKIPSLYYTEYTYTIKGKTIIMKVKSWESEDKYYEYDEKTRTLRNEQGDVYYRQMDE